MIFSRFYYAGVYAVSRKLRPYTSIPYSMRFYYCVNFSKHIYERATRVFFVSFFCFRFLVIQNDLKILKKSEANIGYTRGGVGLNHFSRDDFRILLESIFSIFRFLMPQSK